MKIILKGVGRGAGKSCTETFEIALRRQRMRPYDNKIFEEKTKAEDYFQKLFVIQYIQPFRKVAREVHCNTLY